MESSDETSSDEGHGVTTAIWGPLVWKMIHAILASAKPSDAETVCGFFRALANAMPCKFCRASLATFLETMRKATGKDVDEHVRSKTAEKWGYDLHNLVNDKLDKQAFLSSGGTEAMLAKHEKLYEGHRISFECMQRRVRVQDNNGLLAGDVF